MQDEFMEDFSSSIYAVMRVVVQSYCFWGNGLPPKCKYLTCLGVILTRSKISLHDDPTSRKIFIWSVFSFEIPIHFSLKIYLKSSISGCIGSLTSAVHLKV